MNDAAIVDPATGEIGKVLSDPAGVAHPAVPPGGLTGEHAVAQAEVLAKASRLSPVRQTRFLLEQMGQEWLDAAAAVAQAAEYGEPTVVIELAGGMTRGMRVWLLDVGWMKVTRIVNRAGDFALVTTITNTDQLDFTQNKREVWLNLFGNESPVPVMA